MANNYKIENTVDPAAPAGSATTLKSTDNAGVHTPHVIVDSPGLPSGAATEASLAKVAKQAAGDYETVAASQTAQVLGATGAAGDYIKRLIIVPETTSPGLVTLLDNATSIALWLGGTVGADLTPFEINLDMVSASGAWKITTGANVHVIAVGDFT